MIDPKDNPTETLKKEQFPENTITLVIRFKGKMYATGVEFYTKKDNEFDKALIDLQGLADVGKRTLVQLTGRDIERGDYSAKADRPSKPREEETS